MSIAADILAYEDTASRTLQQVAQAHVPLEGAENARILAWRPSDGGKEHLAIVVGEIDPTEPVLIRLHSECFTGDLLGSLRCDCGVQLRGAIAEIAKQGSGVLLYLAQEGRGIGLVNKLRAYELQDDGFDTIDANEQLGFDADERIYVPRRHHARAAWASSGCALLTNNPEKIRRLGALRHRGRRARAALLPVQRPQRELPAHQGRARRAICSSAPAKSRRDIFNRPSGPNAPRVGDVKERRHGVLIAAGLSSARNNDDAIDVT